MLSRLSRLLCKFVDALDLINVSTGKIVSFVVLPLVGVMVYEVVSRYFFNDPTIWAYDTSKQIMLLLVMLGSAYTLRERAHISIDVISSRLSLRAQAVLDMVFIVLLVICSIVIMWYGWDYAWHSLSIREHSPSIWAPPVYIVKFALPVTGVLLLISVPHRLRQNLAVLKRGGPEEQNRGDT